MRDLVGVGFGPSNLALAIALRERPGRRLAPFFLERSPRFQWHGGMLLKDTTMQISFLKDLVTLRDPRSPFSFLCYLTERGRLVDFVNRRDFFPTRREFHDYLEWAAAPFAEQVAYSHEVRFVRPVDDGGAVTAWDVVAADGAGRERVWRTPRLVLGSGLVPRLPRDVTPSESVWHSAELAHRLAARPGFDPKALAVVGAGQSAAEVAAHLHERFPAARVYALLPRYGYSAADDSPFANRIFDPGAVDDFYHAPPEVRERLHAYHRNTNYSVVDPELIDELHRRAYQESVTGESRLTVWKMTRVAAVAQEAETARLDVTRLLDGTTAELTVDAAVFATGYRPMDPAAVLGPAAGLCRWDADGRPAVLRDYRVATVPGVTARIYLQGGTEHTHGISSSLLSNAAVRAGEIARSCAGGDVSDGDAAGAGPEPGPDRCARESR